MKYSFHPEAEEELLQAIEYYESCEVGLGYDFAVEVYATIERIVAHPKAWLAVDGEIRKCQTGRFPFGVLYQEQSDGIFILAVMHLHREPDYWRHRV